MTGFFQGLVCLDCETSHPDFLLESACSNCGSEWLQARYKSKSAKSALQFIRSHPFNLWRYAQFLPPYDDPSKFSRSDGGTPLLKAEQLGGLLGLTNLYIKDERLSSTASFKDRQATLTLSAIQAAGHTEAVVASTGNVAIAFSAQCARAGIRLWAFLTSLVPPEKMHEVALYGTRVIKVTGTYDQAKLLAAQFAKERGYFLERGARSVPAIESMKTIAFEICEQLPAYIKPKETEFLAPDWYIQAVSGGLGPIGVLKGFIEFQEAGLTSRTPRMGIIQTEGCAPMVHAWRADEDVAEPVADPQTFIATLTTGDPGKSYSLLRRMMLETSGGHMESVEDDAAFQAMRLSAETEGISMEPAAGVAFAGLMKLVRNGTINRNDVVVINCSGHAMPAKKTMLRDDWALELDLDDVPPEAPHEGLYAALASIDQSSIRKILIIDDQADARRLLTRVLAAHGDFEIMEAESGAHALALIHADPPDLIVLDLMMPEMDGFMVLDQLKNQVETRSIPVIVVTAKELSNSEIRHLKYRNARLMQKGAFMGDDLIDEVENALAQEESKEALD